MGIIDKVITEESGKVFNIKVKLLDLRAGNNKDDYSRCEITYSNPIKVYDESKRMIGSASVHVDSNGNALIGNISLDYSTPERLNIQTGIPMYPHLDAFKVCVENEDGNTAVEHLEIDSIWLSLMPPEDKRIAPIY
jgi:hypothetical protein